MAGRALAGEAVAATTAQGEVDPRTGKLLEWSTGGVVGGTRARTKRQPEEEREALAPHALPITTWLEQ